MVLKPYFLSQNFKSQLLNPYNIMNDKVYKFADQLAHGSLDNV